MTGRALLAWCGILVLAILNGALRQGALIPAIGERAGHVVSTLLLSGLVVAATWLLLPWIGPSAVAQAWRVGLFWVVLTIAFEFLAGHYLFHTPWPKLLADYNLAQGRIWILVLITTFVAPALTYSWRHAPP